MPKDHRELPVQKLVPEISGTMKKGDTFKGEAIPWVTGIRVAQKTAVAKT